MFSLLRDKDNKMSIVISSLFNKRFKKKAKAFFRVVFEGTYEECHKEREILRG